MLLPIISSTRQDAARHRDDLVIINDSLTAAAGEVSYLSERILDSSGEPIRNAFVEIWQVDAKASYLHTKGSESLWPRQQFPGIRPLPNGLQALVSFPHD